MSDFMKTLKGLTKSSSIGDDIQAAINEIKRLRHENKIYVETFKSLENKLSRLVLKCKQDLKTHP
jgi:hypothetical protein